MIRTSVSGKPFRLFTVILPIREDGILEHALSVARTETENFLSRNQPTGSPGIRGIWTAGEVKAVRAYRRGEHLFPTMVFSGAVRNQLTIFEKPDGAIDLLQAMVEHLLQCVATIDRRSPAALFYHDQSYLLSLETPPFHEEESPSYHVTKELANIVSSYM